MADISGSAAMAASSIEEMVAEPRELAEADGRTETVDGKVTTTAGSIHTEILRIRGLIESFSRDARAA